MLNKRQIAKHFSVSVRTVNKWLREEKLHPVADMLPLRFEPDTCLSNGTEKPKGEQDLRKEVQTLKLKLEKKRLEKDLAGFETGIITPEQVASFHNRVSALEAGEAKLDETIARFRAGEEKLAVERAEVKREKKEVQEQSVLIAEDAPKLKKYHNELKKAGAGKSIKFPTLSITNGFYKNGEEEEER